jgi:hypothetical protein
VSYWLKKSSNSTGLVAFSSAIRSPAASTSRLDPGSSWMYLRPSAERGRTLVAVSAGSGATFSSSFISATAIALPDSGSTSGEIRATWPMREPPIRTSAPRTRFEPLGSSALIS